MMADTFKRPNDLKKGEIVDDANSEIEELSSEHRHSDSGELLLGQQFEKDFFTEWSSTVPKKVPYMPRGISVLAAMVYSSLLPGWDPVNPPTDMARTLMDTVKTSLEYRGRPDLAEGLRMACAIGTTLDSVHSIDGFFYILHGGTRFSVDGIVTFDVTISWSLLKMQEQKADVLVVRDRDFKLKDKESYYAMTEEVAKLLMSRNPKKDSSKYQPL